LVHIISEVQLESLLVKFFKSQFLFRYFYFEMSILRHW